MNTTYKYYCDKCNYGSKYKSHINDHYKSRKHHKVIELLEKLEIAPKGLEIAPKCPDAPKNSGLRGKNEDFTPKQVKKTSLNNSDTDDSAQNKQKTNNYVCEKCDIKFSKKYHLSRHQKTCNFIKLDIIDKDNKHNEDNNEILCYLCKNKYTSKSGLVRHMKNCITRDDTKDLIIEKLQEKIKEKDEIHMKEKIGLLEKRIEELLDDKKHSQKMDMANACNTNGLIQANMRAITFANKYFTSAPPLEHFNNEFKDPYSFYIDYKECPQVQDDSEEEDETSSDFEKLVNQNNNKILCNNKVITKDEYIVDLIAFLVETNQVAKYFSEKIVYFYKNEKEPHKQSIWNFDTSRYNFGISIKLDDKTSWHTDKLGLTTTDKILNPLLQFTVSIITKTTLHLLSELSSKQSLMNKINYLSMFIHSVKSNTLQPEIIKYISPIMHLDTNKYMKYLDNKE
jgi:hypothetical protein